MSSEEHTVKEYNAMLSTVAQTDVLTDVVEVEGVLPRNGAGYSGLEIGSPATLQHA